MKKCFLLLILLGLINMADNNPAAAQNVYPPDGVYTSFFSFRKGVPDILPNELIRSLTSNNSFTIRQWVNTENLYYRAPDSTTTNLDPKQFWGYVENNTLYLFLGAKFHRITLLGSLSYFLESYPTIKNNASPVVTDARATSSYRILDMETGEILDYDLNQFEELISRDEDLAAEFDAIPSSKQKNRKMYSYLEKYNERNPLKAWSE